MSESQEKIIEILRIINEYDKPVGARVVSKELINRGYDLGERTIRYHMQILDEKGFTKKVGYSGRKLTNYGKLQLKNGLIYDHVDFVFSKFEEMIYQTDFDYETKKGNLVVNVSSVTLTDTELDKKEKNPIEIMKSVFSSGLHISPYIGLKTRNIENSDSKEYLIRTICGTTIDGIFLKKGIPSLPIYGGLIKVKNYVPQRFTELISYKKTSITPINAFIADGMTSVLDVIETGNGVIPANFRVIPKDSLEKTKAILGDLNKVGIDGVISIGEGGEKVLGINVNESMAGIAIIAGITPLCTLKELDYPIEMKISDEMASFENLKPAHNVLKKRKNSTNKNSKKLQKNSILKPSAKEKELKVSFLLSKAWNLIQNVDFDVETCEGKLITNLSYVDRSDLEESIEIMRKSYKLFKRYLSPYYKIVEPEKGTKYHENNKVGIATICSLSSDGVLINKGIMSTPKYGGLLEMGKNPFFTELISYDGSSIDPHEIFIFKNMTYVLNKPNHDENYLNNPDYNFDINGSKKILASIKEVPFIARDKTKEILAGMEKIKLPIFKIGKPRELVYNAKVDRYNFGFVTGSGLNQIAAIKESGIDVNIKAVQGTIEIDEMELL